LKYSLKRSLASRIVAAFFPRACNVGADAAAAIVRSPRVELKERRSTFIAASEHGQRGSPDRASIRSAEEANNADAALITGTKMVPWTELKTGLSTLPNV